MDYLIVDRNWPSKQENYYHALRLLTFTPNKIRQKTDNGRVILQHKINCHKNGNGDTKRKTMKYNEGTFKYMLKKIIGALASIIGGLLVFLCVYWLFRLDTWTERGIYIGASIFLSLILIKILSFFNDE